MWAGADPEILENATGTINFGKSCQEIASVLSIHALYYSVFLIKYFQNFQQKRGLAPLPRFPIRRIERRVLIETF